MILQLDCLLGYISIHGFLGGWTIADSPSVNRHRELQD